MSGPAYTFAATPSAKDTGDKLYRLAENLQYLAHRIKALTRAGKSVVDDASISFGQPFTESEAEDLHSAEVILTLIFDTASKIADDGAQVERAALDLGGSAKGNQQVAS